MAGVCDFSFIRYAGVYYFSFMKLIVSTFLVYKVKKCLLKSGKVKPGELIDIRILPKL